MAINQRLINRIKNDLQTLVEESQEFTISEKVDAGFHVRAIKDFIEKLDKSLGEDIKIFGSSQELTVIGGIIYEGHINRVDKMLLDTDRIKSFLGVRLPQYQIGKTELHLKYKPKFGT